MSAPMKKRLRITAAKSMKIISDLLDVLPVKGACLITNRAADWIAALFDDKDYGNVFALRAALDDKVPTRSNAVGAEMFTHAQPLRVHYALTSGFGGALMPQWARDREP